MDFTWTNPAGGDWTVATNWDPNLVPGPNDNVYILISAPVTLNTNADCGALTLGGPSAFPSLNGNGVLTVHRPSVWSSGGLNGSGRLVIAPEGLLSLANGGLIFLNGWALENGGTIQWGGTGDLGLASSAVITNRPGALFDAQIAASIGYLSGAACRFDNAGTFRKSLATGTNTFSGVVAFNNYGSVEVQTGTLLWSGNLVNNGTVTLSAGTTNRLAGGGSGSGTFTAPATALVEFSGGTFSLDPGAQLNGAGLYKVSSDANLTANTDVPLQNLDLGSTLNGSGLVTVNNVLNWTGGGMDGSGRTLIAPGAALNVNSTTGVRLNRTLENAGTTLCAGSGGFNGGAAAAIITNRPGALFEVRNNGSFTQGAAVCRFDNAGTFRKSLSTGTNTFDGAFNFNNYGVVELQSGTLLCIGGFLNNGAITLSAGTTNRLGGSGSGTGTYTAPATALVEISGAFTLNPGAQLNGAGLYKVSGGSLVANTNVWLQNLDLAGILGGTGLVTVSNVLNWTAGTMDTSGRTLIAPGAALNVNSPTGVALNRTLENAGTTLCTDSGGFSGGLAAAIITNRPGALFEVRNNASFTHGLANCRFDNAGTFRKSLATGTNTFSGAFGFNNYGTVDLRSGILGATGGYTSTTNAMLNCALGGTSPGTGYAQLQVAGTVTLNGALSVGLMNGYLPTTNDSFTVLSAGTRSGTFANFSYPSNQVTMQLSNTTSSVIVRVTGVTAPPPAPLLLTPLLSGTNVLLTWTAVSNILYRLEFNPDLAPSNWTTVPGDVLSSGVNASKLDPLTSSNRFYRVRVLP
jgi:hypothetical protein